MEKISVLQIKLDLEDLNSLLENASRQKSKDILSIEIRKLQTELMTLQNQLSTSDNKEPKPTTAKFNPKCYDVKLNNYAWDQSNEFVKIYVTLNNVQSLPKEAVTCNFSERSMDLYIAGLDNKNYHLPINNLCENINPSKSYTKVRPDMVIVYMAKAAKKEWSCVTKVEKAMKDSKTSYASPDPADDPNVSLMNMMKKMYQDGDDELKKTIAKAWTEGQEKKLSGLSNMPNFGDM